MLHKDVFPSTITTFLGFAFQDKEAFVCAWIGGMGARRVSSVASLSSDDALVVCVC